MTMPKIASSKRSPAVLACSTAVSDLIASRVPSQPIEDASGQTIPLGPGHNHRHSMFYLATGDYSLFNTCNSWTSKVLQAAGLPIRKALWASGVMHQAERYGRIIQVRTEAEQ